MVLTPFLLLSLPIVDLADPPPRPPPPTPTGASKLEMRTGLGVATDDGVEIDVYGSGTGYVVAWSERERETFATAWAGLNVTYYTPADSEMIAGRYWIGPMIRGGASTEIYGRYGLQPGALKRIDFDLGYRFDMETSVSGAVSIGWGVVQNSVTNDWRQGMRLVADFSFR